MKYKMNVCYKVELFYSVYGINDNVYEGANPVEVNSPAAAKGNNIATRLIIMVDLLIIRSRLLIFSPLQLRVNSSWIL